MEGNCTKGQCNFAQPNNAETHLLSHSSSQQKKKLNATDTNLTICLFASLNLCLYFLELEESNRNRMRTAHAFTFSSTAACFMRICNKIGLRRAKTPQMINQMEIKDVCDELTKTISLKRSPIIIITHSLTHNNKNHLFNCRCCPGPNVLNFYGFFVFFFDLCSRIEA